MPRFDRITTVLLSSILSAAPAASALAAPQDGGAARARSVSEVSTVNVDGTRIDLRIVNGEVVIAKVNGEDVAADRVRQGPDGVEVLDERGAVVHRFAVRADGAASAAPNMPNMPNMPGVRAPRAVKAPQAAAVPASPAPKSMIGVGFAQVDEALAHHLKVDPAKCMMVSSVIDGMPAHKAGIEKFDVIVSIDGKPSAGMEDLRRLIAATEPGTKLKLAVRRGAETKEFEVESVAFDPAKLAVSEGFPIEAFADANIVNDGEDVMFFIGPDGKKREMRVPSVRGLPAIPNVPRLDPRQFEDMERSLRELIERMDGVGGGMGGGPDEGGADDADVAPAPRGKRAPNIKPAPNAAPRRGGDASEERLRRMEERMEQLRRELEREREARKAPGRPADA